MKILIAEDEPLTLLALEQHLKSTGYDVITATDGRDALNKLQAFSPQLIITDIMMPFTSGLGINWYNTLLLQTGNTYYSTFCHR